MIKRWIIKLFKIKTYEEEYHKFKKLYEITLDELNMTRTVAESYRANLEDIKSTCDEVINKAEKVVAEFENPERRKENYEHRAYANGRRDAYAEMGIKADKKSAEYRLAVGFRVVDEEGFAGNITMTASAKMEAAKDVSVRVPGNVMTEAEISDFFSAFAQIMG